MDDNTSCSMRLRVSLQNAGMKQIELSQLTGIPKSAICQYLSGKVKPKQDKIFLMAKALHVSELWLMGYDVDEQKPVPAPTPANSPQEEQLLAKFRKLDADNQEDVMDYVDMRLEKYERSAKKDAKNFG